MQNVRACVLVLALASAQNHVYFFAVTITTDFLSFAMTDKRQQFVNKSAEDLMNNHGVTGAHVMEGIRSYTQNSMHESHKSRVTPTNINCVRTLTSQVRMRVLEVTQPPPTHVVFAKAMRERAKECGTDAANLVDQVLRGTVKQQWTAQQEHARKQWSFQDTKLDTLMQTLPLVPPEFFNVKLTPEEKHACRQSADTKLLDKELNKMTIQRPDDLLATLRACVSPDSVEQYSALNIVDLERSGLHNELGIGLIGVSGRRFREIFNTKSSFTEVAGHPTLALFDGQLKTSHPRPYIIPLLVDFQTFIKAYRAFCANQSAKLLRAATTATTATTATATTTAVMTDDSYANHNRALRQWLTRQRQAARANKDGAVNKWSEVTCVHALRSLYAQMLKHTHDTTRCDNLGYLVWGHESRETGVNYTAQIANWSNEPINDRPEFPPRCHCGAALCECVYGQIIKAAHARKRKRQSNA